MEYMKKNNRQIGTEYEQIAGQYLIRNGYQILEYNYRCPKGEVDIVARQGAYLVFCEVKFRSGTADGYPEEAVGRTKQKKISECALYYLTVHGLLEEPCRFDVITILGNRIRIYPNAFDYTGN